MLNLTLLYSVRGAVGINSASDGNLGTAYLAALWETLSIVCWTGISVRGARSSTLPDRTEAHVFPCGGRSI